MSKRPRRTWTDDQKQALAKEAQRRLGYGESLAAISRDLDVLDNSLRLWMVKFAEGQFLPLKIEAGEPKRSAQTIYPEPAGTIALTTPGGFRFECLDVGDVAVLLEQLR